MKKHTARLSAVALSLFACGIALADDTPEEQVLVTANRLPQQARPLPMAWSQVAREDLALVRPHPHQRGHAARARRLDQPRQWPGKPDRPALARV